MMTPEARPPLHPRVTPDSAAEAVSPAAGPAVWHGAWTTPVMRPSAARWFETWAEKGFTNPRKAERRTPFKRAAPRSPGPE